MEKKTTSDTIMAQVSGFLKKLLLSIMFFSTLLIFFLEFFYDLKKEIFLNRVVLALDIVLLISFFLLVILRIIKNHKILPVLIRMHKADTAYLFLIIAFLVLPRLVAGLV